MNATCERCGARCDDEHGCECPPSCFMHAAPAPTPSLAEYLADDDPNKFWRLSSGDHENLLDEAIDERDGLIQIFRTVSAATSHGEQHWWLVIDDAQPLTDAQAEFFQRLVEDDDPPAASGAAPYEEENKHDD